MGSKNNPGQWDCYANAEPDEPMFVLLGRDPTAWAVVYIWAELRSRLGDDSAKLEEAMGCALSLEEWARSHGKGERVDRVLSLLETMMVGMKAAEKKVNDVV